MTTVTAFDQFALDQNILKVLDEVGYETASLIQAQTIPLMLAGKDLIGQAQTGTGKTAAFALPILSNLNLKQKTPQVLVLAPTRELAIQVAEAFQKYAKHLQGFRILPIYGGQDYRIQIRALERGIHIVVGTPGRVMDLMRRGNLKLNCLTTLILDEADEMLRMGFIEDVEWILEQTPAKRQIALFSATMPAAVRRVATRHLNQPVEITIQLKTMTAEKIRQRFWPVSGMHKLDALTRILEFETFEAMIIFVRTKTATLELAEKLAARGFAAAALNGDIQQKQRERTVEQLKKAKLDILVATDVAARGLDVTRVSHVINYDIPQDTESYVHRIGRTGRAGRSGDAILFVAPREKRMLQSIEKVTNQKIERMNLPSTDLINDRRIARFKQRITDTVAGKDFGLFRALIEEYQQEQNLTMLDIAASLAEMVQGDTPFFLPKKIVHNVESSWADHSSNTHKSSREHTRSRVQRSAAGMQQFRVEMGHNHHLKPGNIVGAIAAETDIDSQCIGRISIFADYSLVDLPDNLSKDVLKGMREIRIMGQLLAISSVGAGTEGHSRVMGKEQKPGKGKKALKGKIKKRARDEKDKGRPKRIREKQVSSKKSAQPPSAKKLP